MDSSSYKMYYKIISLLFCKLHDNIFPKYAYYLNLYLWFRLQLFFLLHFKTVNRKKATSV